VLGSGWEYSSGLPPPCWHACRSAAASRYHQCPPTPSSGDPDRAPAVYRSVGLTVPSGTMRRASRIGSSRWRTGAARGRDCRWLPAARMAGAALGRDRSSRPPGRSRRRGRNGKRLAFYGFGVRSCADGQPTSIRLSRLDRTHRGSRRVAPREVPCRLDQRARAYAAGAVDEARSTIR
jgi:hypothetical protein